PASYSLLSSGNTLFSVGIYGRTSKYMYNEIPEYQFSAMADHFALGFKMKRRMGMAFGLKPFSGRGYSFTQKVFTGTDSLKYVYSGQGGIQDLFLGFSYGIIQKNSTKLSIGFNASYLFGIVTNEKQAILIDPNTFSGGIGRNSISLKAFNYEFGAFFRQKIGKRNEVTLSAVYAPSQSFNATFTEELLTASNINTLGTYDTLDFIQTNAKAKLGMESKYGLSYQLMLPDWKRKTRMLHPQITVLASLTSVSAPSHDFQNLSQWNNLTASKIGFGIQFKPESKLYENISTLKFLEKISYRVGTYSALLPYASSSGTRYKEQALTVGFGMPILAQQGLSSLNLSICFGKRGVDELGYTSEEFLSFNFGLVISPSNFDRWFRKRKLD
ncbi:MAG: hypothetical protein FJZ67_12040, partial [Bacteroidetes bacterium]|nr:hypothetical protein [Bacteroidota bacterium]